MPVAAFSGLQYCTVAQIQEAHAPLASSLTDITSAQIALAAWRGEADIHAKLAAQFTLPFTYAIPTITQIAIDLGIYYSLRHKYTGDTQEENPWIDRYKDANELLDLIAKGDGKLISSSGDMVPKRSGFNESWSNTMNYIQTKTELDPSEERIDPDKIDDLRAERDVPIS